jgi:phenylacetate-CoA ligase
MPFFHLRAVPGNSWPALPDGKLSQVWAAYQALDRTQWLEPAALERQQLTQVRTLLAHAVNQVPYYRQRFAEAGIFPGSIQTMDDFRRIPLLSRATYQERFADLAAAVLPAGTTAGGETHTSGSSGVPVTVLQTNMVLLWWFAFLLRDLEWCGFEPSGTLASIRTSDKTGAELERWRHGILSSCWLPALETLIETGPAYTMDIQQDHTKQLHWLRSIAPDYLLTFPSNLEVLARLLRQQGEPVPRLRAIQTISEPLTDEARARIEAAFGVPVKNTYSCCEAGYLASPCPEGHGLHVHSENVILEVLDAAGRPCAPNQTGRVVVTALHNFRAPFIRYQLDDAVVLGAARCPCGRGLPLLARVDGKQRVMFRLAGGRLKSSSPLADLLEGLGGHRQHQVIQRALDHVVVRLVIDRTWTGEHGQRLRRLIQEFFEAPVRVDMQVEEQLRPPASGKLQSMACEISH